MMCTCNSESIKFLFTLLRSHSLLSFCLSETSSLGGSLSSCPRSPLGPTLGIRPVQARQCLKWQAQPCRNSGLLQGLGPRQPGHFWKPMSRADPQAPPQTQQIRICALTGCPGDSRALKGLRGTERGHLINWEVTALPKWRSSFSTTPVWMAFPQVQMKWAMGLYLLLYFPNSRSHLPGTQDWDRKGQRMMEAGRREDGKACLPSHLCSSGESQVSGRRVALERWAGRSASLLRLRWAVLSMRVGILNPEYLGHSQLCYGAAVGSYTSHTTSVSVEKNCEIGNNSDPAEKCWRGWKESASIKHLEPRAVGAQGCL